MTQKKYTAQEFIDNFLIKEVKDVVDNHPFLAFFILCSIIEVLGKCLNSSTDWQKDNDSGGTFKYAIESILALNKYKPKKEELYKKMRCGLLHAGQPENGLILTSDNNDFANGVIGCKELYDDIKKAWNEILSKNMCKKKMSVKTFTVTDTLSGTTQSLSSVSTKE